MKKLKQNSSSIGAVISQANQGRGRPSRFIDFSHLLTGHEVGGGIFFFPLTFHSVKSGSPKRTGTMCSCCYQVAIVQHTKQIFIKVSKHIHIFSQTNWMMGTSILGSEDML